MNTLLTYSSSPPLSPPSPLSITISNYVFFIILSLTWFYILLSYVFVVFIIKHNLNYVSSFLYLFRIQSKQIIQSLIHQIPLLYNIQNLKFKIINLLIIIYYYLFFLFFLIYVLILSFGKYSDSFYFLFFIQNPNYILLILIINFINIFKNKYIITLSQPHNSLPLLPTLLSHLLPYLHLIHLIHLFSTSSPSKPPLPTRPKNE